MSGHSSWNSALGAACVCVLAAASAWGAGAAPKAGGVLNAMHREDPPSLSIHEEATISTNWAMMPCYSNLVLFNPLRGQENGSTLIGELAEKWEWRDGGRALAFTLRGGC
jgi:peptide/nickel transport system substrate-binding protein